jgi:hypothetical protein
MALQFSGILNDPIYTGASTSRGSRWVAADYIDRVLFAAPSAPVLFWPGAGKARPVPGLTDTNGYDGVEIFDGHVMLWRGPVLKWSAGGDFANWIPVGITAASGRATLESDLVMTPAGSTTGHAFLTDFSGNIVVDQFVRLVSNETDASTILYDYFQVRSVALETEQAASTIKRPQSVPAGGKARIYLGRYDTYVDWTTGARLKIGNEATNLYVTNRSRNAAGYYQTDSASDAIPAVGGPLTLTFDRIPTEFFAGDVVSVGPLDEPGQDLYQIKSAPSYATTLTRLGIGDRVRGSIFDAKSYVSFQNWVEVENTGTTSVSIPAEAAVSVITSVVLEPLGLTGGTDVGKPVPAGAVFETLDANDAGELANVGSTINGDILAVVTLAEFAYILKHKSIQSIQSVGPTNGTFFLRPEILDEGPVGRYAWCRYSDREVAFIGSKGFYIYGGGQNLRQFGLQHWFAFREELDVSRADEIVSHHNRANNEVWFSYPTLAGETKVLVYNYVENSVVVDRYPTDLNGITALGRVDWELAPTWESLSASETCAGTAKRWYEYVDVGEREYTLIGIGGTTGLTNLGESPSTIVPRLLVHGRVWSRFVADDCSPVAIHSFAETPDFDFGDPKIWKYVDTVFLVLSQKDNVPAGVTMQVSVGARDNLNSPIRWSAPQNLSLTAASSAPTKINTTMSGRYLRVRFESNYIGANWGISAYHITARKGGTY